MKLLAKINRSYFKYGVLIFLLADVLIILLINFILKLEIDQQLKLEVNQIAESIQLHGDFRNIYPTAMARRIDADIQQGIRIKDTLIYDEIQHKAVPFREYAKTVHIAGKSYCIISRQMLMEFDDYFVLYASLISVVLVFVFAGMFVFARRFNARIWEIFNQNVKNMRSYSFDPPSRLTLARTGIDEFDELNLTLTRMSDRLEKDYTATKEFSAHMAHEMQTPLAIIRNKCEHLFSDSNLSAGTAGILRDIYLSADRLSGTLKALLLLAKIEHGQFHANDLISFNELFRFWQDALNEVLIDHHLSVSVSATANCRYRMDKRLANLLVQNVFINAVKHSSKGEKIEIFLSKGQFRISNPGDKAIEHPHKIFETFYKESPQSGSTGIGLAIVRKIADYYRINITYSFNNFKHTFMFTMPSC
ncbi:MAG: sensor histidine kinase [Mangrovibacterium sp.]